MADDLVGTVGQRTVRVGEQTAVLVGEQEARSDGVYAQTGAEFGGEFAREPLCPAGKGSAEPDDRSSLRAG